MNIATGGPCMPYDICTTHDPARPSTWPWFRPAAMSNAASSMRSRASVHAHGTASRIPRMPCVPPWSSAIPMIRARPPTHTPLCIAVSPICRRHAMRLVCTDDRSPQAHHSAGAPGSCHADGRSRIAAPLDLTIQRSSQAWATRERQTRSPHRAVGFIDTHGAGRASCNRASYTDPATLVILQPS